MTKRIPATVQRSRLLLFALLVFAYIAQPALALIGMQCLSSDCLPFEASCCTDSPLKLEASTETDEGCCSEKSAGSEESSEPLVENRCNCQLVPAPLSTPESALPSGALDSAGTALISDWIRIHAGIALHTPSGPVGNTHPPNLGTPGMLQPPCSGVDERPATVFGSGVGAWTLLMRGVCGYLAALSVALL